MAAEVTPLQPVLLPKGPSTLTGEQKYWRTFASQLLLPSPHSNPITYISHPHISTAATASLNAPPETFTITSGSRIQIFSSRTRKLLKTITRFNVDDVAHSGTVRRDGRIVLAGGDSGAIQAFDVGSRAILKTWREHKQPVWCTQWHPTQLTELMSASDDRTVRLWDLPSDGSTRTFTGHQDYVRCGSFMTGQAQGMLVTGSYDQTVRLWDPRMQGKSAMTFAFRAAVEAILPMPSGTSLIAASGESVNVLDLVAAKPLQVLKNHQRTVTCLSLASEGKRIVSGALDGHIKVFETQGWNVVAGSKYPSPILSMSVVPSGTDREDKHIVVGMQNGLLSIKTRLSGQAKAQARERKAEMQAMIEGKTEAYDKAQRKLKRKRDITKKTIAGRNFTGEGADIVIDGNPRGKLKNQSKWETQLRKGQYEAALDTVLAARPLDRQNIYTLITALRHRSALRTALAGRDEVSLQPILKWLVKNINDPRHVKLTTDVALVLLDLYAEHMGRSSEIDKLVENLHETVRSNAELSQSAYSTKGMLDMLMAGA